MLASKSACPNKEPDLDKEGSLVNKVVVNMSSYQLTDAEKRVLEKGLNFAPAPRDVPKLEIMSSIEPALRTCEDQMAAEVARAKIASILKTAVRPNSNICKEELRAMQSLKKRKDIIIAPADKGNATVVLDAVEYEKKALEVIGKRPFEQVKED